jgi:4-methylaminobutanoate oxidase (formaldehyde-forming)
VTAIDATSALAQINLQGPRSRDLLQSLTSVDLSHERFPFRHARDIDIGYARVLCIRITYIGELGYELYIPTDQAQHVYDRIVAAGRGVGLRHAGLKALSSLRLEKGYRDYGHDIDNLDDPFEAGLEFAVSFRRGREFIGRRALEQRRTMQPPRRRLLQVLVQDPEPLLYHGEVVRRNGSPVGTVRAGSYGFTLGGAVGLVMVEADRPVDRDYIDGARWDIDIAGVRYPAAVSLTSFYDPTSARVKV